MRISRSKSKLKYSATYHKKHPGSNGYQRTGSDTLTYSYRHVDPYFGGETLRTVTHLFDWKAGEWQQFLKIEPVMYARKAA